MTLVDTLSKKLKKELLEFGEIESSVFLDTENKGPSKFYKMFYFNFFYEFKLYFYSKSN